MPASGRNCSLAPQSSSEGGIWALFHLRTGAGLESLPRLFLLPRWSVPLTFEVALEALAVHACLLLLTSFRVLNTLCTSAVALKPLALRAGTLWLSHFFYDSKPSHLAPEKQ